LVYPPFDGTVWVLFYPADSLAILPLYAALSAQNLTYRLPSLPQKVKPFHRFSLYFSLIGIIRPLEIKKQHFLLSKDAPFQFGNRTLSGSSTILNTPEVIDNGMS